jgi:hypothetical protein
MADSLDKFVLQYTVELKDSIKRLEQLQDKVRKTASEQDKVIDKFKELTNRVMPEIGAKLGGIERMGVLLSKIPPAAYGAVAALLAVAGAIKLITYNMREYDAQRATAQRAGMSPIQVEDFQRQFARGSGGRVGPEAARNAIETIADKLRAAQTDPNMNNRASIALRMAGVSVRGPQGELTSTTEAIKQMMDKMAVSSEQVAVAMGTVNGLTIDQAKALREYAIEQGRSSTLTNGEFQARQKANASMEAFRRSMGAADEQLREARQTLADSLTPALEAFGQVAETVTKGLKEGAKGAVEGWNIFKDFHVNLWKNLKNALLNPGEEGIAGALGSAVSKTFEDTIGQSDERQQKATEKVVKEANKGAELERQNIIQYERAANLFSNAVMSFANAIDEREAWAAWAGLAGAASGLRNDQGPSGNIAPPHPRFGETPVAGAGLSRGAAASPGDIVAGIKLAPNGINNNYDSLIAEASKKYGVPFDLIKKVISGESKFDPNITSPKGAMGLMQLMPEIQKAYGIANAYDPASNIMGGTRLLAENLKATGGNVEMALKMYHGGPNQAKWGRYTNAYPSYILGQNIGQAASAEVAPARPFYKGARFEAPSPSTMARDDVIRNIEAATGVPFAQIKQGGLSKGDMSKVMGEMYNGQINHINSIKTRLEGIGLPATEVAKLKRELQDAQKNLETMKKVGGEVVGLGAEGGRNITFGANSVIISVNGSDNPFATARAVKEEFYKKTENTALVNQQSNSIKR